MPTKDTRGHDQSTVRDAFEQLHAGRLDGREFIQVALRLGSSAAVAASMAGVGAEALASVDRRHDQLQIGRVL